MGISRRLICQLALAAFAMSTSAHAQNAKQSFPQWVEAFRARARARGISDATYSKVMEGLKPDTSVYTLNQNQDEFREEVWQYLNRRVSEWRITTGRERSRQHEPLLTKLEREFGVDRFILLGLWGMETAFGDIIDNMKHMRPVFPALAALAWGEPRRRAYWEQELLNALVIVERNWSNPKEMIGSWAGAMGHTQWMPEVWLNIGADYDGDGRASPFGRPDDALAGTSRYLLKRGNYRRGEGWGFEARLPNGFNASLADNKTTRSLAAWAKLGVVPAANQDNPPNAQARLWRPVAGGPAFLLMQNFYAVRTYNPSMNYTLAIVHLADRIRGLGPLAQSFPGAERAPTLAEVQEIQRRLTASGFDTDGVDGRVGRETMRAVRAFQNKAGLAPADGYAGLKVLARLRQKGS